MKSLPMHGYVTKPDPGSQMPSSLVLVNLARRSDGLRGYAVPGQSVGPLLSRPETASDEAFRMVR